MSKIINHPNLEGWRVNREFYLHEIALLTLGYDPANYSKDVLLSNAVDGFLPRYRFILNEACSFLDYEQSQEYPDAYYKSYELMTNNKPESLEELSLTEGFGIKASKGYIVEWINRNKYREDSPLTDSFFTESPNNLDVIKTTKIEERIRYILEVIDRLGLDKHAIESKKDIEVECLANQRLFTESTFLKSWSEGSKQGKFSHINKSVFAPR